VPVACKMIRMSHKTSLVIVVYPAPDFEGKPPRGEIGYQPHGKITANLRK
jgi:hypothetical protein